MPEAAFPPSRKKIFILYPRGEVRRGEDGQRSEKREGLADDGKRLGLSESALGVLSTLIKKQGEGSGEGWVKNRAGPKAGGFLFRPLNDEKQ